MEKACGLDRETAQESIDGFLIAKDRCKLGSRSSGLPRSHDDFIQRMTCRDDEKTPKEETRKKK